MNRFAILLTAATLLVGGLATVQSQAPKPTNLEQLQKLKAANEKLLEQQEAALQKLDDLYKEAQQARTLARRT